MKLLKIFIILLIIQVTVFANEIRLLVPEYKPYTYTESEGKIKGIGVEKTLSILNHMGIKYSIKAVPNYEKALSEIKLGKADAFFLSSKNKERDEICEFSKPVFINKWSWFMLKNTKLNPKDESFKKNAKIGVILNTNQQSWATERGYNIVATSKDILAPPKMLKAKRVDAFLMAELVFWSGVEEKEKDQFKEIEESEQDFGIYVSKEYLKKNDNFMKKLNDQIEKEIKVNQ